MNLYIDDIVFLNIKSHKKTGSVAGFALSWINLNQKSFAMNVL